MAHRPLGRDDRDRFCQVAFMVGLCIGLLFGFLAGFASGQTLKGPDGSFKLAALDLAERVAPEARAYTRYLSLYACAEADREAVAAACAYWANSLSYRRKVAPLVPLAGGTLLRLDLRDLGWDRAARAERLARFKAAGARFAAGDVSADAWETLTTRDPYFEVAQHAGGQYFRGWIDPDVELSARTLSRSSLFVVRAETFLLQTGLDRNDQDGRIDGLYSDFLILPRSVDDVRKAVGIDEAFIGREGLAAGGALIRSGVARHNRGLEWLPTLLGGPERYWWQTYDVRTNVKDQSVLETFLGDDGFSALRADGGEYLWELPNGLMGRYASDGAGKQVGEVPADIAQGVGRDAVIFNAYSCDKCHQGGINEFRDVISAMATAKDVALLAVAKGKDKAAADRERRRVEDYYLGALQAQVRRQRAAYAEAVTAACGLEPEAASAALVDAIERHLLDLVDLDAAAREFGVDRDRARELLSHSGDAGGLAIVAGEAVPRDLWERQTFAAGMLARTYEWEDDP